MNKALDGINLVEFDSNLGAAYAAMLLAEQGARAVNVEPPGGARERGTAHFHALNRSKRALFLDVQGERARVERLLRWADVAVFGWTGARMRDSSLITQRLAASIRTWSCCTFRRSETAGHSQISTPATSWPPRSAASTAASGRSAEIRWRCISPPPAIRPACSARPRRSRRCMRASAPAANCRGRQLVEVSLLAGAFSLQTGGIMRHEKMTRMYEGPLDPLGPIPCYRLFRAADGEYFFVACGNITFWNKLALAIERPELVSDPRFEGAPWGVPSQHRQALKDLLQEIFATRPREEWLRILRENDIPCAPVLSRTDFINHPQVDALGMRRAIDDPTLGATIQPGIAVGLELTPGEIAGPAPAVSHDRAGIFRATRRSSDGSPSRRRARTTAPRLAHSPRGPLDGLLILDFCSYIAGSYGPMILGQMGADVIKIESLEGDAFRHFGFGFLGWNQGKRALSLDLGSPEGREIIHGLVRRADIVVENLRPGRMRRFGLDYQSLAAINPRLIYMSVNGFGNRGPEHNQPGFDPLLQARSGVMAAQGGPHQPSGLSHLRDLRLRRRDALGVRMRAGAARARAPAAASSVRPRCCSPRWRFRRASSFFTTAAPTWKMADRNRVAARRSAALTSVAIELGYSSMPRSQHTGKGCGAHASSPPTWRLRRPRARRRMVRSRRSSPRHSRAWTVPRRWRR